MKILIIHQHFRKPHQGGALRSYYIARELVALGHEVSIIASNPGKDSKLEKLDTINIRYLQVSYENHFGFLRRMLSFSIFVLKALLVLRFYKSYKFLYVMSTPLSVGIIGLFAKWIYKKQYSFEVGDLWPDIPIQMGIIRNKIFIWITLLLEQIIYNNASFIVALSADMKSLIQEKVRNREIIVIENFCDLQFFGDRSQEPEPHPQIPEGKFVISYFGTLGIANKVGALINLAEVLDDDRFYFVIQGVGKELQLMSDLVATKKLTNFAFIPFGDKIEIRKLLNNSDAIFVSFDYRFPLLATGCPNKLMDGLAAGKIILVNYGGWQRELIEEANCGLFLDTQNLSEGRKTLVNLFRNHSLIEEMKSNSRKLSNRFAPRVLINVLNNQLAKIANG